jgi:Domain of unknown function (DUF1788)
MSKIGELIKSYEGYVKLPWARTLSGAEKTWFAVYDPVDERRLRLLLPDFETATKRAGHGWAAIDITDSFPAWMATQEYRESYFENPADLEMALRDYEDAVVNSITKMVTRDDVDANTVIAIYGVASLFGFIRVSDLIARVAPEVRGRLLVFFPGEHDGANYRMLDARDGWNYLAVPITASGSN